MYAFTFEAPSSTAAAAQLIAQGGKLLAGGQSLLPSMRLRLANPEKIVDLNSIAELAGIRREGNALVIGAMTRHADVASSADCLLYTSPSPRDKRQSRMPSSA